MPRDDLVHLKEFSDLLGGKCPLEVLFIAKDQQCGADELLLFEKGMELLLGLL